MFTVTRNVGRLIEVIMRSPVASVELDGADADMGRILSALGRLDDRPSQRR